MSTIRKSAQSSNIITTCQPPFQMKLEDQTIKLFSTVVDWYQNKELVFQGWIQIETQLSARISFLSISADFDSKVITSIPIDTSTTFNFQDTNMSITYQKRNLRNELRFKTTREYIKCKQVIFHLYDPLGLPFNVFENIYVAEVNNLDFLVQAVQKNPKAIIKIIKYSNQYIRQLMNLMENCRGQPRQYSKIIKILFKTFLNVDADQFAIFFCNELCFDKTLNIFQDKIENIKQLWQQQKINSLMYQLHICPALQSFRFTLMARNFLESQLLDMHFIKGNRENQDQLKVQKIKNNQGFESRITQFSQTETNVNQNLVEFILSNQDSLIIESTQSVKKEDELVQIEYQRVEQSRSARVVGDTLTFLFLAIKDMKKRCNRLGKLLKIMVKEATVFIKNSLSDPFDQSAYNLLEAYSSTLPINFFLINQQQWRMTNHIFLTPKQTIIGSLVDQYNKGNHKSSQILNNILINIFNEDRAKYLTQALKQMEILSNRYTNFTAFVIRILKNVLDICQTMQIKLAFIRIIQNVIGHVKLKDQMKKWSQMKDSGIDKEIIAIAHQNSNFYYDLMESFKHKRNTNEQQYIDLAIFLRIVLQVQGQKVANKNSIFRGQQIKFIDFCLELTIKHINQDSPIKQRFLAAFQILENIKIRNQFHQFLSMKGQSDKPQYKILQHYLPWTLLGIKKKQQVKLIQNQIKETMGQRLKNEQYKPQIKMSTTQQSVKYKKEEKADTIVTIKKQAIDQIVIQEHIPQTKTIITIQDNESDEVEEIQMIKKKVKKYVEIEWQPSKSREKMQDDNHQNSIKNEE